MINNFFSLFKGLYNQSDTKNDYLVFKNNDDFFCINMSKKHIKCRKIIFNLYDFFGIIIYFSFIREYLLNYTIYIRVAVLILLIDAFLLLFMILGVLFDYYYCRKMIKKNRGRSFKDQDVINKNFYNKDKVQYNYATKNKQLNICNHKPQIKIRDIFHLNWIEPNKYLCRKCGLPIKLSEHRKIMSKLTKNEFMIVLLLLIMIELFLFVFVNFRKGIIFILKNVFEYKDILLWGSISVFDLVSYLIIVFIVFVAGITCIYYRLNYFGKFDSIEPEGDNSDII